MTDERARVDGGADWKHRRTSGAMAIVGFVFGGMFGSSYGLAVTVACAAFGAVLANELERYTQQ